MLRGKFKLESVTKTAYGRNLELIASNQKDGDNLDWSKYTPNGSLKLSVSNDLAYSAIDLLKPGTHFFLDLIEIPFKE